MLIKYFRLFLVDTNRKVLRLDTSFATPCIGHMYLRNFINEQKWIFPRFVIIFYIKTIMFAIITINKEYLF